MPKRVVWLLLALFLVAVYFIYSSETFAYTLYQHYPGVSYYYIGTKLTEDEPDAVKKYQILVDYVHQNVFVGPFGVIDWPPLDNLIRGVGWCDQVAHIFIRLLEPLDVRGYLVFLNRSKDGTGPSPHSIAVITPKTKEIIDYNDFIKEGVVCDLLQGVIFMNGAGKPATFGDICSRDVLGSQRKYFADPAIDYELYCNKGRSFLSNTPISVDNKKRRFFYKYIYPYLPQSLIYLYQDMTLNRWYRRNFYNELDFIYFKARNYHIYERFTDANRLYDIVISKSSDKKIVSECLFFQGMLLYRAHDLANANERFKKIIKDYPDSPWVGLAKEWSEL